MPIKGAFYPTNILGEGSGQDWKIFRYPFADAGTNTLDKMKAGFLVKFNAAGNGVEPALAADDAVLGGVLVDLPDPGEASTTVAVAVAGTFNRNQIHYADAWEDPETLVPISAAGADRLRNLNIFLDPAVPAGPLLP